MQSEKELKFFLCVHLLQLCYNTATLAEALLIKAFHIALRIFYAHSFICAFIILTSRNTYILLRYKYIYLLLRVRSNKYIFISQ